MILNKKVLISLVTVFLILISILIVGCAMINPKAATTTNTYPDRPITIIVPFSAGGSLDLIARALEKTAVQHLGQPLIVVNKPGAAGTLAWNELTNTAPDGYTIGITGVEIILHPLYGLSKYNYPTSLEPLVQVSSSPFIMVVQANQPWQNVDDLVKDARQHPGQLKFGNSGVGSLPHLLSEMFAQSTGTTLQPVPFQGGSESLKSLLGGHVQAIFTSTAIVKEHLKNGTLRALAVTGEQRLADPAFANVPTFKELGKDIVFSYWIGVAAPKEMPLEVKEKLANGLKAIIAEPEFQKNVENNGLQFEYLNPKEFQEKWLRDNETLSKTVKETGILERIKEQKK